MTDTPIDYAQLGQELIEQRKWHEAASAFEQAVATAPHMVELWNNLGAVREEIEDFAGARDGFARAVALEPASAAPYLNLGSVLMRLDAPQDAVPHLRTAASLAPDFAFAWRELGRALELAGRPAHAAPALRRAVELEPEDGDGHLRLGCVLLESAGAKDAIPALQRADELLQDDTRAKLALGHALLEDSQPAAALAPLEACIALDPNNPIGLHDLGKARAEIGDIEPALAHLRAAIASGDPNVVEPSTQTLAVLAPGSLDETAESVLEARRNWAAGLPTAPRREPPTIPTDALRIGYVSSFFQHANWMKPVWSLVHAHDRDRVEVHLFGDNAADELDADYRPHRTDRFHDLRGLDNEAAAELVRAADLDLLIDLNGYSRPDRLGILSHRPAPRIAEWFNMYATSGLECVDFLIGDDAVLSPDEEEHYVETVVRVPGSYLTFRVEHPTPDVTTSPCASGEPFTFGCLASQYKLCDAVLEAWCRILAGAPESRLLLRNRADEASIRARFAPFCERHGIDVRRIEIRPGTDHFAFLGTYGEIDLALDPFPYNGGTTTTEALWQGVPVMCYRGDRWASRTSASILLAAGLDEFVAADREEYVSRAIAIATESARRDELAGLRSGMRERLENSPVCDTDGFARNMESLFEQMCCKA